MSNKINAATKTADLDRSRRLRRRECGADCVQPLIPALCARTRNWTGRRELFNQAALA